MRRTEKAGWMGGWMDGMDIPRVVSWFIYLRGGFSAEISLSLCACHATATATAKYEIYIPPGNRGDVSTYINM